MKKKKNQTKKKPTMAELMKRGAWKLPKKPVPVRLHEKPVPGSVAAVTISKHTPGPWRVASTKAPYSTHVIGAVGKFPSAVIATCQPRIHSGGMDWREAEANARLIAAAPDMWTEDRVYSLCEAVADLALNFAVAPVLPGNSRDLISLCIEWAKEFEQLNAHIKWGEGDAGEYIEEIDKYFAKRYARWRTGATDTRSNDDVAAANEQVTRSIEALSDYPKAALELLAIARRAPGFVAWAKKRGAGPGALKLLDAVSKKIGA